MWSRWGLVLVLVVATLAGPAAATHDTLTIPLTEGTAPVDDALGWLEEDRIRPSGCVQGDPCSTHWTKWIAVTAAHVGVHPEAWPSDDASPGGWLLDHADDLRDEQLVACQEDPDRSEADCADDRVFSLAKSVLAFRSARRDARHVPLPDGGERDLVAELLDEHGSSEFGRTEQANDDIWALIALNSVGYEGAEVDDTIQRIEQAQGVDGGVAYGQAGTSTVDITASAVMALAPHDRRAFLEDARGYLANQQVTDGDRRGCWTVGSAFSSAPNAESTARAIHAIAALGEDPLSWSVDDQSPIECLISFQRDGGFYHADGGAVSMMPTQQSLAALAWRPYGSLQQPTDTLEVTDEATVGQEHTASVPGGQLRLGTSAVPEHTWTPEETGQRTFHGFTTDPARPVELVVDVQEADEGSQGSSSSDHDGRRDTGSSSSGDDQASGAPHATIEAPARADRNVTFTVHTNATPGKAPVTAFRLQVADREPTDWRPAGTFHVELATLGDAELTAWARDAEGRVSSAARTTLTVVDATPRIEIEGPSQVNRSTPATFTALAHDPDGPIPRVEWTPEPVSFEGLEAAIALKAPGPHTVQARAADEAGNAANATLTVHALNRGPRNLTVEPTVLEANATEVLHAQALDPDGDELTVAWRPAGADRPRSWGGQLHLGTGSPGNRALHVNVSDPYGAWTSARVDLTIREDPDQADGTEPHLTVRSSTPTEDPTARPSEPAGPARITTPDTITATANRSRLLHGTAQSPAGDVLNVTVALGGPVPVRGTSNFTALLPALPAGEYELASRAADLNGWGPWANTTLVVELAPEPDEPLTATSTDADERRGIPLGFVSVLAALLAAAGRRDP